MKGERSASPTPETVELARRLFADLRAAADGERAAQMAAYMRDQFRYLGVQTPARRKISRPFLNAAKKECLLDWDFVDVCWRAEEREFQYVAADYLRKVRHLLTVADLPRIRGLAVTKPWWDTVDSLNATVGSVVARSSEAHSCEGRELILKWARDESMWVRRLAIDHQLQRKESTDVELLSSIIEANLGSGEFFIDKAIGWALRDYSKTDPEWVRAFIAEHRRDMAALAVREASKYL